jgi:hypothetical protein
MWEKNAYYNPDALGLTVVAELEFSDKNYCYDTRVVWQKDGVLYTARDSGCSCPTPFENYTSVESLERVNMRELKDEIKYEKDSQYRGNPSFDSDSREFLKKVKAASG